MKQCANGHIFDEKMYNSCPYCNDRNNLGTRPLDNGGFSAPEFPKTSAVGMSGGAASPAFPKTEPLVKPEPQAEPAPKVKKEMGVTVALNITDSGINPLRGWLVAVSGDKTGISFPIHSEKNFIGRGQNFDIDLSFDRAVSKEGDAAISYDARNRKFYLSLLSGKNNVYYNDGILLAPVELSDYDTIEIGSTKLVFRSFCNAEFTY